MNEYIVHSLTCDTEITINAYSPEQALLLVDFHENKESLLKLLPTYIKNHDLVFIKNNHVFYYGNHTIGYNYWCIVL